MPQQPEDLTQHRLVHYVGVLGSRSEGFLYEEEGKLHRVPMAGSITVNNTDGYESACLGGFGLIQAPLMGMHLYLLSGELVAVLPQLNAPSMDVSLLYARQRHLPLRVRAFMDWLGQFIPTTH